MPPVEFEPTIPVSERPKTHALDRTATGIGIRTHDPSKRAVEDPRLRPHGHWDRQTAHLTNIIYLPVILFGEILLNLYTVFCDPSLSSGIVNNKGIEPLSVVKRVVYKTLVPNKNGCFFDTENPYL
jgi:hypothetical protein